MPPEFENEDQDLSGTVGSEEEAEESTELQGSSEEPEEAEVPEQESQDSQDEDEDAETEDGQEEKPDAGVKNQKTGNFDWKKINEKIGNVEVERAFKESQRTISRVSQENKQFREQVSQLPSLQEKAQQFEYFDHLVRSNPDIRSYIQAKLEGRTPEREPAQTQPQLPPGVHPDDPLVPLLMAAQNKLSLFEQRFQQEDQRVQQSRVQDTFRQGLVEAKDRFKELVGRDITEQELRSVAQKMKQTNVLQGADWVPSIFVAEIQKATQQKFFASRKAKQNLPKTPNGVRSKSGTAKPQSIREAFDKAWDQQESGD
jgi:hypothetical protein